MNTKRWFIYILIALFMIIPSQLLAQGGNIKIGNLKIIPGITGQAIYDDNIYLKNGTTTGKTDANTKISDWIYHVQPSLLLNYTIPERGFVNLGYQGDWAFYNDNNKNNWKSNKGSLAVDYKAPGGLLLGINNLYSSSEDPYGSPDQYAIGRVTSRWDNDLKTKIGFLFSERFRSFVYYNYYKQEYKDVADATQNYNDNEFGLGFEAKLLPKTWGFIRYHYGTKTYDASSIQSNIKANSNWHKASAGLTWDAAAKLSGELNVGYQWKSYENEQTGTAGVTRAKSKDTWIAATAVTYKPFETTNLSLNITRALRDTAADSNEYFEDTGIGLTLQQTIFQKLALAVGGMYSRNEYNTNNRNDDNYLANAGLEYKIREWLSIGVGYNYKQKYSNIKVNEYTDNQFVTSLKLVY